MIFLIPSLFLFFLLGILLLAIFFVILQVEIVRVAFGKLGIPPGVAFSILILSLFGSAVNIPLCVREAHAGLQGCFYSFLLSWRAPEIANRQVIAINVGGAIIPLLICIYLLTKTPLLPILFSSVISVIVCHMLATVVPGKGIVLPAFIPPVIAVILAFLFAPRNKVPVAYVSGVLGVLIGADLLNLPNLGNHPGIMSIGGAGVYDGIFLVGIISALLA